MPKVLIDGRHFYYEIEGKGPPLVLIAGYCSDHHIWDTVREGLASHFQLLLFDNRGIGQSDPVQNAYTVEDMAADATKIIHSLKLKTPHILGTSMGASVAQVLAKKHAKELGKVILAYPFLKLNPVSVAATRFLFHLRMDGVHPARLAEGVMPWLFSREFMSDSKKVSFCIDLISKPPHPLSPTAQKFQLEALVEFDSTSWFHTIKTPLLIMGCEEDILCPPWEIEKIAKDMSHAQFTLIPKMSHAFHIEKPEEFIPQAIEFLK